MATGDDPVADEGMFQGGPGLELFVNIGDLYRKAILGLAFENDRAAEQAIPGAVGARRFDLTFGIHTNMYCMRERGILADWVKVC